MPTSLYQIKGGSRSIVATRPVNRVVENTWQSFRIGYSLHTPPEISQRYTPKYPGSIPTYRREIKLTAPDILSDIKRETLEDAQSFIEKVLNSDLSGQVFVVRVDTGAGKTEYAILIKGARPILLVGSHDLGTEIYSRAKNERCNRFPLPRADAQTRR